MFENIKGIGPKKAKLLNKLGIEKEEDLLFLLPIRYEDKRKIYLLKEAPNDTRVMVNLKVNSIGKTFYVRGKPITKIRACDDSIAETSFFYDKYRARNLKVGSNYYFYGKVELVNNIYQITNPSISEPRDENLRIEPVYPLTKGLHQKEVRNFVDQALANLDHYDFLYKSDFNKENLVDILKFIHRPNSFEEVAKGYRALIYRKIFLNILALNYIRNIKSTSKVFELDYDKFNLFKDQLDFELTDDQNKVIGEIATDLEGESNLNRLVQGDVGSGKTLVAICAGVLISSEAQVAMVAPTEILARQHYENFKGILESVGISTALLVGSTSSKEKSDIKAGIGNSSIDFIFGTHALFEADVIFEKLSLVIVDEQHKFGVKQRSSLIDKSAIPNVLVMSATPIPRTLAIAKNGDMDISTIMNKPKGRKEIKTYAVNYSYEERIFNFIEREVEAGHQVYIVCPAIEDAEDYGIESVESVGARLSLSKPSLKYSILHGDMKAEEKEEIIASFERNDLSVLISTTVVEVGIDVANASLMVIYNAERFGLSQLHQLRGRIGRSSIESYCVLMLGSYSKKIRARLEILCKTNDGFLISEEDLKLRGPGELLGSLQHGQVREDYFKYFEDDIFERAYRDAHKMLDLDPKLEREENRYILYEVNKLIDDSSGFSLN